MTYFSPTKYIKDESRDPIYSVMNKRFFFASSVYPFVFVILGIFFTVTQIVIPIVALETTDETSKSVSKSVLGIVSGFRKFEFNELSFKYDKSRDTNKLLNGSGAKDLEKLFGKSTSNIVANINSINDVSSVLGASNTGIDINAPEFYYLTIPKLGISKARVESKPANLDPDKALGHYVGSAFPGEVGNAFIYGHSVLPAFYNPKNYKSIFSTLSSLDVGDKFTIDYNNKTYTYSVEGKKTLKPEQVDPLATFKPGYLSESTVTLMTCSPAGTKLKRLLVYASLVE
ncbi:sortase [candidate division WWE3 bacterium]|nr:sortase [candidate division WWE3 bacterium]